MNITPSMIYWIMKLDDIQCLFFLIAVGAFVACIVSAFISLDDGELAKRVVGRSMIVLIVSLIIGTFVPSTKQAAAMYVVPAIANSDALEKVINDPGDLYNIGVNALKEKLVGVEEVK